MMKTLRVYKQTERKTDNTQQVKEEKYHLSFQLSWVDIASYNKLEFCHEETDTNFVIKKLHVEGFYLKDFNLIILCYLIVTI